MSTGYLHLEYYAIVIKDFLNCNLNGGYSFEIVLKLPLLLYKPPTRHAKFYNA